MAIDSSTTQQYPVAVGDPIGDRLRKRLWEIANKNEFGFPRLEVSHSGEGACVYLFERDRTNGRLTYLTLIDTTTESFTTKNPAITRVAGTASESDMVVHTLLENSQDRAHLSHVFYETYSIPYPHIVVANDPTRLTVCVVIRDKEEIGIRRVYERMETDPTQLHMVLIDVKTHRKAYVGPDPSALGAIEKVDA